MGTVAERSKTRTSHEAEFRSSRDASPDSTMSAFDTPGYADLEALGVKTAARQASSSGQRRLDPCY
jgi:hypothetical protein